MARELTRRRTTPRDTSYAEPAAEETPTPSARGRRGTRPAATEEVKPTARRGGVSKGWGAYKKTAEATKSSGFAAEFKPTDEQALLKILDDGPFAVFKEHWISELPKGTKKSYTCLKDDEGNGDCPLCDDLGDSPKARAYVNVVDMLAEPKDREVLIWKVGSMVGDILEKAANEKRSSPLNREGLFWSVDRTKKGQSTNYQIQPVKEDDDFESDWDTKTMTPEEFDQFESEGYDDSEVYFNSVEDLSAVVELLA